MNISEKELKELRRDAAKLHALETGGVDSWEFYGESLKEWRRDNELDELLCDTVEMLQEAMIDGVDYDFPAGRDAGISLSLNEDGERCVLEILKDFISSVKAI